MNVTDSDAAAERISQLEAALRHARVRLLIAGTERAEIMIRTIDELLGDKAPYPPWNDQ